MRRICFLSIMIAIIPILLFAQVKEEWVARYNGPSDWIDYPCDIAADNDGNIFVTGFSADSNNLSDFTTIKYDPNGLELWVARFNGTDGLDDGAWAVAPDSFGNVFVTGYSRDSSSFSNYVTVKYDSQGKEEWIAQYDGPGNQEDIPVAVAVDRIGNVYVTGYSWDSNTSFDYATVKYSPKGREQWVARYSGFSEGWEEAKALVVDALNEVCVTGYSRDPVNGNDIVTVKYDRSGVERWVARYNGPGNGDDQACAIVSDKSGNIYVTGSSWDSISGYDYVTLKYNSQGKELWAVRYNDPWGKDDKPCGISLDDSRNIYVAGSCKDSLSLDNDYVVLKYNSQGLLLWAARYNGPDNEEDEARAVTVGGDGGVYITGSSGYNYLTVKYDTKGAEQWVARYVGPEAFDFGCDLTVDKRGGVYVTGRSGIPTDYCTVKYSQGTGISEPSSETPAPSSEMEITSPIASEVTLRYSLSQGKPGTIELFDASGRMVESVTVRGQGEVKVETLSSGVYFARLQASNSGITRKVVIVR